MSSELSVLVREMKTRGFVRSAAFTVGLFSCAPTLNAQTIAPAGPGGTADHEAGTPIPDETLPPGMMTVRVVQGGFPNNVEGAAVTVEVVGNPARVGYTTADGRAVFAQLPLGVDMHAAVVVADEPIASDVFTMPADSGVRILLIARYGDPGAASALKAPPPRAGTAMTLGPVATTSGESSASGDGVLVIRVLWIIAMLLTLVIVVRPWRRRRSGADVHATRSTTG